MSDYVIISPHAVPGPVTVTHSSPQCAIGLEVDAVDRAAATSGGLAYGKFVYCRGSNGDSNGRFVNIVNGSAVLLNSASSNIPYPIGAAPVSLSATNVYGWVQVKGHADYLRGTNTAPEAALPFYVCGTAGYVITNIAVGSRIHGILAPAQTNTVASSSGGYRYFLDRPYVMPIYTGASNATVLGA